jgi:hypothetical protein
MMISIISLMLLSEKIMFVICTAKANLRICCVCVVVCFWDERCCRRMRGACADVPSRILEVAIRVCHHHLEPRDGPPVTAL